MDGGRGLQLSVRAEGILKGDVDAARNCAAHEAGSGLRTVRSEVKYNTNVSIGEGYVGGI